MNDEEEVERVWKEVTESIKKGYGKVREELIPKVIKKFLENGWVLIEGDLEAIDRLEWEVYTPNTEENRWFTIFQFMPFYYFGVGKKTKKLQEYLKIDDDQLKRLLKMKLKTIDMQTIGAETTFYKSEKTKEIVINEICASYERKVD